MTNHEAHIKSYGWVVCDFDGDDGECDNCGKDCNPTYYRRTSYEYDEGEYSCLDCLKNEIEMHEQMYKEFQGGQFL